MDRKPYYVTIQAGVSNAEVRNEKGGSSFDFEIIATEDEAGLLKDLFEEATNADRTGYVHSHFFSNVIDAADRDHMIYDRLLHQIYQTIYSLGTEQTKADIDEMGVLDVLKEIKPSDHPTGPSTLH